MTNSNEQPGNEQPGTYVVPNRNSKEELIRLTIQDQMITTAMGGVLPEQPDPGVFQRILDIGCGTGSWIIEAARTYPEMKLNGIDISKSMIEYAREQAHKYAIADRAEFHVMDALVYLEFPDNFFDLVNLRFGISFLRTWDWPKLLYELQRVTRPNGIIRITDEEVTNHNNSAALMQLFEAWQQGLFRAGHIYEDQTTGLTAHLLELITRYGVQRLQSKAYALEFQAGTPEGQAYYEDMAHAFRNVRPFLDKWGCLPTGYDDLYQQAVHDMQQPGFHATWNLLTVWGHKPRD
jgi:ubiquinone/menaquinone biosynthesis C-methylase UbiE